MSAMKLPKEAEDSMSAYAAQARAALARGDTAAAEAGFLAAWNALPEPRLDYDYAQSLAYGLVMFFRDTGQFDKALTWMETTRKAYGGGANQFVEFLGATVAFAAGELDEAFRVFDAQFKQYGERPFRGEDPKYLAFYKKRARQWQ